MTTLIEQLAGLKVQRKKVRVDAIVERKSHQIRTKGVDEDHARQIADAYESGKPVDPPRVFLVDKQLILTRGHHRLAGAKLAKKVEIEVEVVLGGTMQLAEADALVGNPHRVLSLTKAEKRETLFRLYDGGALPKNGTATMFSDYCGLDRTTVERLLREHDPEREKMTEKVDAAGRTFTPSNGGSQKPKPSAEAKKTDKGGGEIPGVESPPATTTEPTPTPGGDSPPAGYAGHVRGHGTCTPDPRFMPHLPDAEETLAALKSVKARMESVRADMRKLFAGKSHPVGSWLAFDSKFDPAVSSLIQDVGDNLPTDLCPACFGRGATTDRPKCRGCDGYGVVTATTAAGLAAEWKKSEPLYEACVRDADLAEVQA